MRSLSDLAAAIDGTALLVHHPGWSDHGRVRGGYAFEANADEVLVLAPVGEDSDVLTLTNKKVKEGPGGAVRYLRRRALHGSVVIEHARPDDAEIPMRGRVLAVLGEFGRAGATGPQLAEAVGITGNRSSLYRALTALRNADEITSEGKRGKERYWLAGAQ